jgi:2-keto-4-pentenoate hydratase/2-oxohepta-3-ene-1,7-dioic acid hydratase in catechol pathway
VRFVSYYDGDAVRPGYVSEGRVHAIDAPSMAAYIAMEGAQRAQARSDRSVALDGLPLAAPVVPTRNVFCVGRNYLEHAKEGAAVFGKELKLPDVPTFFTKAPTAVAAPGADLHLERALSNEYDYEAEFGVVIGRRCKDVSESDALDVVFGYTCVNDVTARDLQRSHVQWFKGKSLDDACPIGPWIVEAADIPDPHALSIGMTVNGTRKQHSSTGNMIFRIPRLIAELSKGMTLLPGDVIATGTPEGVGFARNPPEFLADGDVMEIEIERIGTLRNTVRIA